MRNNEERFGANPLKQDASPLQQIIQQGSQEQQAARTIDFIVPTEMVELPSKGRFYRSNHPLSGQTTIEIKQMTAKEEDILNSRTLLKKGIALDKLIQSLVVDKNINTDTLTVEDRNAILVAARISAYGSDYLTEVVCPSCGDKSKHTFNVLDGLKVTEKENNSDVDSSGYFTIILPSTKWTVVCRALNGGDEKTMVRLAESKKKNDAASDSMLLEQLKLCIVSIEGVTSRDVVHKAIDSMPAKDSKYLRTKYQEIVPSIKVIQPFSCKNCDHEADLEVPFSTDFFWFK